MTADVQCEKLSSVYIVFTCKQFLTFNHSSSFKCCKINMP